MLRLPSKQVFQLWGPPTIPCVWIMNFVYVRSLKFRLLRQSSLSVDGCVWIHCSAFVLIYWKRISWWWHFRRTSFQEVFILFFTSFLCGERSVTVLLIIVYFYHRLFLPPRCCCLFHLENKIFSSLFVSAALLLPLFLPLFCSSCSHGYRSWGPRCC